MWGWEQQAHSSWPPAWGQALAAPDPGRRAQPPRCPGLAKVDPRQRRVPICSVEAQPRDARGPGQDPQWLPGSL